MHARSAVTCARANMRDHGIRVSAGSGIARNYLPFRDVGTASRRLSRTLRSPQIPSYVHALRTRYTYLGHTLRPCEITRSLQIRAFRFCVSRPRTFSFLHRWLFKDIISLRLIIIMSQRSVEEIGPPRTHMYQRYIVKCFEDGDRQTKTDRQIEREQQARKPGISP